MILNRNFSDPSKFQAQELKESLNEYSTRNFIKIINKDPSFVEKFFSDPKIQKEIQDIPIIR